MFLILSIINNLGNLALFKYYNFFATNVHQALDSVGMATSLPVLQVVLPVGISFYTFQSMSYSIDAYRRHLKPIRNYVDFSFYITFFPQLVAGPIVHHGDFAPQTRCCDR